MFYSMRIVLLTCLASFSGMQAMQDTTKEQLFSFLKGAAPVTLGMGVGYIAGKPIKHQYVTTAIGALGGAALDHYYLGGKEDKNQMARKSGNVFPVIIAGGLFYYNAKTHCLGSNSEVMDVIPSKPTISADSSPSNDSLVALALDQNDAADYKALREAVFTKLGKEFASNFKVKYSKPSQAAVNELAAHIDSQSAWKETCPARGTVTIGSQKIELGGTIANMISRYCFQHNVQQVD